MQDLIKYIRCEKHLSQQKFAEELKVSFATVNRWEQGKNIPNEAMQNNLFQYAKKYNIDIVSYIVTKYNNELKKYLDDNKKILFHGSKSGIVNEISPISRKQCDFGKGFYMGDEIIQPLTLICNYDDPKLYIIALDLNNLKVLEIPNTIEWALTVAYHRGKLDTTTSNKLYDKYKNMFNDYDVIIGSIADDRMFYVLDNFFENSITDKALVECLATIKLGKQYVAITQKACEHLMIKEEITLSKLELYALQDISKINRQKGIDNANEICKIYRRDGKFFDEILGDK